MTLDVNFTAVFFSIVSIVSKETKSVGYFEGRVEQHINLASALPAERRRKKKTLLAASPKWC